LEEQSKEGPDLCHGGERGEGAGLPPVEETKEGAPAYCRCTSAGQEEGAAGTEKRRTALVRRRNKEEEGGVDFL
jgi:hypothetical protein